MKLGDMIEKAIRTEDAAPQWLERLGWLGGLLICIVAWYAIWSVLA